MFARFFTALTLALATQIHAQDIAGVGPNTVQFAQVAALDGPAGALGQGMRTGILAAFEEANAAGGVHGRDLLLDSHDDGYEPGRSAEHLRRIIAEDQHLGVIGAVGTPTSKATQPLATQAGLPFIGPLTGAGFLRDGALSNVLNVRATYGAETERWISYLAETRNFDRIAILYQDDGFGRVGLAGVTAAMDRRDMTLVASEPYMRNTTAVKMAMLRIRKAEPDAVVMVGAYRPIAAFIALSRTLEFNPEFVNISFVGSRALADELGHDGEGVIISQVVPFPWDDSLPIVARYQRALRDVAPDAEPDFISLEGYLVGQLAIAALDRAGPDLTRGRFLSAFRRLGTVDLGGAVMQFGPRDNQGMDNVFLTRIGPDGTFEQVEG